MKRFSEDHLWLEYTDGIATIGVTVHAAEELGVVCFVELPEIGSVLSQGDPFCVVESDKAASDVFCPVGGTVTEVNDRLEESPGVVNDSAEGDGWLCRLGEVDETEIEGLMTEETYERFLEEEQNEE